jgi:hypothetical protein
LKTVGLDDLTQRVRQLLADSKLKDLVRGVTIQPATTYGDDDVLRVHIKVAHSDRIATRDASEVIKRIVDELWSMDDRFPSVRFDEAA